MVEPTEQPWSKKGHEELLLMSDGLGAVQHSKKADNGNHQLGETA